MNEVLEGIVGAMAIFGGLCGFIYWVFGMMEKRLESKIDSISTNVHRIADELREERRSKDALYKFVLDNYNKKI